MYECVTASRAPSPKVAAPTVPNSGGLTGAANAQKSHDQILCDDPNSTDDQTIASCTAAIRSGRLKPADLAIEYYNRGIAFRHKGDYDRAIADYTQAITLDPKYENAYVNRGNMYREKGDFDRAIADYTQVITLDPKYENAYFKRGNMYREKGDFDRAIADYSEAIRLDPENVATVINRGVAYDSKGDHDHAIADDSRALDLCKQNLCTQYGQYSAYDNRGDAYLGKGDYDHAIADYTNAIRLDPKNIKGYFTRGIANLYAGALPKALADLNQASELDPKDAAAALWLDIANRRSNLPSRLPETMRQIDMTERPAPVIRLYLGQLTPEAVLAAADNPDATTKKAESATRIFTTPSLPCNRVKRTRRRAYFVSLLRTVPLMIFPSMPPPIWNSKHSV
jgi:tetratricopeptide (TPR) repeat protein